jgi:hypothetical protein
MCLTCVLMPDVDLNACPQSAQAAPYHRPRHTRYLCAEYTMHCREPGVLAIV